MDKDIISKMGNAESVLRDCLNQIAVEMGFSDSIVIDGETITKEQVERWGFVLEEIDKVCFYV